MLANGLMQWLPTFFTRNHDMGQSQVGMMMALFFGTLGALGALVSGKLADRLSHKGFQYGMWMVAGAMALAIPFWTAAFWVDNLALAMALFIIPAFTGNFYLGPSLALIQTLSPVPMRAVASAIAMFCLNLIGMGLGPLIVGLLSDSLIPLVGDASLKIALASFCLLGLWGAFHFALCGKALARQAQNYKREV
jgi:MFS family permease